MFLAGRKNNIMITKILSFIAFLIIFQVSAQSIPLSKNAQVSILTIGTSHQSYALYGHTGIRFKDDISNIDVVFNYGAFDFETKNFMLKFVKGDLQYFVSSSSYADFEYTYKLENRSIYEQKLNLPTKTISTLFTKIYNSTLTNERFYTYKFIDKNCTVIVIDKINETLGSKIIDFKKPKQESYRNVLFPYTNNHFFQQLGINIIFGTKVDEKAKKLFLPLDLMNELKSITYKGKPLVNETKTIFTAQKDVLPYSFFDSIYALIVAMLIIILINKPVLTTTYFFILGLLGLFFSIIGLYSLHQEVLWNYNVLLFNPFYILLLYFVYKKNHKKIVRVIGLLLILLTLYLFIVSNKVYLVSILPVICANYILLLRFKNHFKIFKNKYNF